MDKTLDWAKLPYFLAVARSGSLRTAAETLGATHATVNRNLGALEETYGVRLFERSKKGLVLTSAGEALVPLAEEAETAVIAARRRLQGLDREASGTIRFSIPTFFGHRIPGIIARFERTYPDIELRINVTDRFEDLDRDETDVSIRIAHQVDDSAVAEKILRYASAIYASQDYLDRNWESRGPKGEGLQWIGWGDGVPVPDWVRASPFPKARVRYELNSPTLIAKLVAEGVGMSRFPVIAASWIDGMIPVPGTEPYLDRSVWIMRHSELRHTIRVQLLVDHLARELQAMRPAFLGPLYKA